MITLAPISVVYCEKGFQDCEVNIYYSVTNTK